ncbi:MAG: Oligopeptide-binding protein AppA [Alphaproteobacteria bacterium MarineAlpha4_Bin2]|nr:MAG: Oligopeptide-binding protein AppA [Alphaproteobacteria bacterium MarineAlpha4_Bin2]
MSLPLKNYLCIVVALLLATDQTLFAEESYRGHGLAMHGDLKYQPDFAHFDYVNPNAPKGGETVRAAIGGYDTFNPFVIKGRAAAGSGSIYDTLMESSADEPFSQYGLIAESVETPPNRSWVAFTLRKEARWHDGQPITVDDVIWTFNTLTEKGRPFYRFYYGSVSKVERIGERTVKFSFKAGENRELPLILGQLTVLPKHYWKGRDFEATTLKPPIGSGPYRIASFEPNRNVVLERVEGYWARNLGVKKGKDNYDRIRFEYYRDTTVALEAFKAGEIDMRSENSAKNWATGYDTPAVRNGLIVKQEFAHNRTAGMQGFVFNLRKPIFQDRRVRQAVAYGLDFEWSNKALFHGMYKRTRSFFDNSELSARGLPEGEEKEILERLSDKLPPEVLTKAYEPPKTNGNGKLRYNLRAAAKLLKEAGWAIDPETRKLVDGKTGAPFAFEVLLLSPLFERIVLPFKKNLARLGINVSVRTVDTAQYRERLTRFDYDMVVGSWGQSLSPGNEQRDYWTTEAASRPRSRNLSGLANSAVDKLVELLIAAPTRKSLVARTRALDRALQWSHIVVPHWHISYDRIARWDKFGIPKAIPIRGVVTEAWWIDATKEADLVRKKSAN